MMMLLDADRPFLEQLEEMAVYDDNVFQFLIKDVYGNQERLMLLESFRLYTATPLQSRPHRSSGRAKRFRYCRG